MLYDISVYESARSFVDPSLKAPALQKNIADFLAILQNQFAGLKDRFNVLEARHIIEDQLEIFDSDTGLATSPSFEKLEKEFRAKVRNVDDAIAFVEPFLKAIVAKDTPSLEKSPKSLIKACLDLEINRFLTVQEKSKAFVLNHDDISTLKKLSSDVKASDLEALADKLGLKSILPLLGVLHALHTDREPMFLKTFQKRNHGP